MLQDLVDDLVRGDRVRLSLELQEDSVAQCGVGYGGEVLECDVVPAFEQSSHLAGEDQRLQAARAGAIPDVLANRVELGSVGVGG